MKKNKGQPKYDVNKLDKMIIGSRQYSDHFGRLKLSNQYLDENKDQS